VKRGLLLLVALVSTAVLVSAFAGRSSGHAGLKSGVYTFDEAVKAGIEPSLQQQLEESGLPLCPPPNVGTGGYKSPKALRKAIAKAPVGPTCMADPRGTTISVCRLGDPGCIPSGLGLVRLTPPSVIPSPPP
jgi:hypothetical protein